MEDEKVSAKKFVTVILQTDPKSKINPKIDFKIMVNKKLSVNHLLIVLKKKLYQKPDKALYLFFQNKILKPSLGL